MKLSTIFLGKKKKTDGSERKYMALTSERVKVFLSDPKIAQDMMDAVSAVKRGEYRTFSVPFEIASRFNLE